MTPSVVLWRGAGCICPDGTPRTPLHPHSHGHTATFFLPTNSPSKKYLLFVRQSFFLKGGARWVCAKDPPPILIAIPRDHIAAFFRIIPPQNIPTTTYDNHFAVLPTPRPRLGAAPPRASPRSGAPDIPPSHLSGIGSSIEERGWRHPKVGGIKLVK